MFFVYALENKAQDGDFYFGFTADLRERLKEHNRGDNFSTKYTQWRCVYYEACLDEDDARRREKYLKTSQGRRLFQRRIKEYLYKRREK